MMHRHETIIYWSDADRTLVAEVPELPSCLAHGSTQAEALSAVQEAIQLWLETAKEFGDPIPVPNGRTLMLA